jgi:hypothetical protein
MAQHCLGPHGDDVTLILWLLRLPMQSICGLSRTQLVPHAMLMELAGSAAPRGTAQHQGVTPAVATAST